MSVYAVKETNAIKVYADAEKRHLLKELPKGAIRTHKKTLMINRVAHPVIWLAGQD